MDYSALNAACLRQFGTEVTYQPYYGESYSVTVVWASPIGQDAVHPAALESIFASLSDFVNTPIAKDQIQTSNGDQYTVTQVRADGAGGVSLTLQQTFRYA